MDFVRTGPSGSLYAVIQELASIHDNETSTIRERRAAEYANRILLNTLAVCFAPGIITKIGKGELKSKAFDAAMDERRDVSDYAGILHPTCVKIQAMLDKWDGDWQMSGTALETWLDALEGYCYDVEDIVDGIKLRFFQWKRPLKVVKLHRDLENVSRGIERVFLSHSKQQLRADESLVVKSLLCYKAPFVGRDRDVDTIIKELLSEESRSRGVSIIGMDGLGKTSLAQSIVAVEGLRYHFDVILSASVSAHFHLEDTVHKLVADHFDTSRQSTESYQRDYLQKNLEGKRALILLDDLWSVTDEDWERFQYIHSSSYSGSRILITTRNPKVAEVTGTTAHYLDRMTDKECRNLIMEKADLFDESEIWASDVEVIAEKCRGMPIVASMFGFKLSRNRSLDERIESIAQFKSANLWELPEFKQVFPSLKLNEPKLAPHLKRCFAFFSLFSPNHAFAKDDLIQLWEAEGFVRPQNKAGWQPTGNQCFSDLLSRSILHQLKSNNEMPPLYEMDDFNYEFAKLLASKAFLKIDNDTTTNFLPSCKNVRHLSWSCENIDASLEQMKECKGLRTFILPHQPKSKRCITSLTILRRFKNLRLLDLSHTKISKLPMSLSRLQHLRYLDLSNSEIQSLPEPISPLRALQSLNLQNCPELKQLPKDLNQLINLMHLKVTKESLSHLPSNLGMLTNLQTLSSYVVGNNEGNTITELKNMEHLRELHISGLENIRASTEVYECMFSTKHTLKRLGLEWDIRGDNMANAGDVLEALEPHNELKDLIVRNYQRERFPEWLISPSRKLVSISLENCCDCKVLPSLGQLPLLKMLVLRSFDYVEIVDEEFCGQASGRIGFPSLESLEFCKLLRLHTWIGLEGAMPRLHSLKINKCPKLASLPSLFYQSCLVKLEIISSPELKSLPELSPAVRGELEVITDSPVVEERCKDGGVDCLRLDNDKEAGDGKVKWSSPESVSLLVIGEGKDVMLHSPEIELRYPVTQPRTTKSVSSIITSNLEESPGASGEERGDKVEVENTDHYPNTAASSHEVLQDPSKVTPPSIPAMTHHPDTASTSLENRDDEDRLGEQKQVLGIANEVEGKKILFLFGEGCQFEKDMLIQLWMAVGLLTDEPMEEIGSDYFEKLVCEGYMFCSDTANSLYKVNTEKLNDEMDMIRDKRNYAILGNGSQNDAASAETLHASVVCDEIDASIFKTLGGFNRLRTLLFLGNYGSRLQQVPRDLFLCYESLVTLDLSGTHIKELPSSAGKMINLRYLDVSWTFIEVLPERIDRFQKLQTLKLEGCSRLSRLPKELKWLTELRHLHLDVLRQLASFPEGIGALLHIRTLSGFPVGTQEGLKIGELKHLNNIMGTFCIAKMENVQSADEAKEASLTAKRSINKLELRWSNYQLHEPRNEDESILGNLCPHSDLEEIQIICYPGTRFPDWIADVSFQKLVRITMFRCVHVALLPTLGKLPSLVSLELFGFNSLTKMDCKGEAKHVAFPKLQKLAVDEMLIVQTWTQAQEGDYPFLGTLSIKDCPKLLEPPSLVYLPSLKNLELSGCTELEFVSVEKLTSSLQQLIVEDCPLIEERCSHAGDEDWHKIQHVPTIWINRVAVQTHEDI